MEADGKVTMSVEQLITVVSCIVGLGGFFVAFYVMWSNKNTGVRAETKEQVEVHSGLQSQIDTINAVQMTRLDAIDNGIRDLKAERRADATNINKRFDELRDDLKDVHDEARHAMELAEAAHRRLDRMGAEPDPAVRKVS